MRYLLVLLFLVGCTTVSGPQGLNSQIAAGQNVIYQYVDRTARLCVGVSPALTKAECQDRINTSIRAQTALDAATAAVTACAGATPCPGGQNAVATLQAILIGLESYVYRSN